MPVNELEQHPYIQAGEAILATRMIVGTFPIYSLTNPRTPYKIQLQNRRGDISFFYGSNVNVFWSWYQQFVDPMVNTHNVQSIIESLQVQRIAISDVISECSRVDESFEDSKLRKKKWNILLANLIENSVDKIICTSKASSGAMGWLRDKVLIPSDFKLNQNQTTILHHRILNSIQGSNTLIKPIAQVLTGRGRRVCIVALPSPGSPKRRLVDFGYVDGVHTTENYLQSYLHQAFNWFLR